MNRRRPLFSVRSPLSVLSAGSARAPAVAVALALCAAVAVPGSARETAATPPSPFSRIVRTLGLQAPPGERGDKAYRDGDYEEALRQYGKAVAESAPDDPERRLLDLNAGNAHYRLQRWPEAIESYSRSLGRAALDSGFAARAHHNLGNAFYRKAEAADSAQPKAAIADLREAVAHYKKALRMDTRSPRSKQNLEQATARLQHLLEQQQQQQQQQGNPEPQKPSARAQEALARALQLTQERRYAEAEAVLKDIMRTDPTASSYAANLKRLDDVRKILRGERPEAAAPGAPQAPGGRRAP